MAASRWLVLGLVLFVVFFSPGLVQAEVDETIFVDSIKEQLEVLELEELTRYVEVIDPDYREYLPSLDWRQIVSEEAFQIDIGQILKLMLGTFFKEIILSGYLLKQLIVVAILTAFLHQLQASLGNDSLVNLAFAVSFFVIVFIGLQSFRTALNLAYHSLNDLATLMYAILPLMSSLMAAVGGITSAALFHPVLLSVVTAIVSLSKTILFPLLNINALVGIMAHFSKEFPLERFANLLRQVCIMLLSFFFTVFLGILAVRGAITPVTDGVALRTAKFLTSSFVPVIGSMFANAVEVVVGGSLLIKNTVGIFGLMLVFFMVALPSLKIWAIIFIYKVTGALLEPICDSRIIKTIASLESSLTLIFISLATVGLMFFIVITILIGFSNFTALMR